MTRISLSYFYHLGHYINGLALLRRDTPEEQRGTIIFPALMAVKELAGMKDEEGALLRLRDAATFLLPHVEKLATGQSSLEEVELIPMLAMSATVTINEELERVFAYRLTDKGNLSVAHLVNGAAGGYPASVRKHLNQAILDEIDDAGVCLACALNTACGFHILRSVEIAVKGYVHAATGALPAVNQRNWGEYIRVLQGAGAGTDLIDLLRILKTKRNPLMHPQDSLQEDEAIDLFCICQSVTGALVKEVAKRSLDAQFVASLALLATI